MIAIITADIVNSTHNDDWKEILESNLIELGTTPKDWNIYRGDSFQLRIQEAATILEVALIIKSSILQLKHLDVRLALGIGEEQNKTAVVTQNTGSAYIHSGRLFEQMESHLAIKTPWENSDEGLNAGLLLLNTIAAQWTPIMATYVNHRLRYPEDSQSDLAKRLQTTQSNVSRVLARAAWQPIEQYLHYFETYINSLL